MRHYTDEEIKKELCALSYTTTQGNKSKNESKRGRKYINIAASFDTETSNFKNENSEKIAIVYIWMFAIESISFYGRTWEEFIECINMLADIFKTDDKKRLLIYVHNLGFDFQFFRKWLEVSEVFAVDSRTPCTVSIANGIEFRCSYILSGFNLDTVGKNLKRHNIRKLVGALDYNQIRHSETPLTSQELEYCEHDVLTVSAYISECMEEEGGDISKIPLTATGYVRRECRDRCLPKGKENKKEREQYYNSMQGMTMTPDDYKQFKRAFQGGFTHASTFWAGYTITREVQSRDFTSSYPFVMCSELFPCSKFERLQVTTLESFETMCNKFACIFDIYLEDIESILPYEFYLSESKCRNIKEGEIYNGRIESAKSLTTTITNVDWEIIKNVYKFNYKNIKILNFKYARQSYLPRPFINYILDLYEKKTKFKDDPEHVEEYKHAKEMLNSLYGMMVTDPINGEIPYIGDEWGDIKTVKDMTPEEIEEACKRYNKDPKRFTFYPWGVFVTAYARRNLWTGIQEAGEDYIYSDTDSIKLINIERHEEYFNEYNLECFNKLANMCNRYGFDIERTQPKTIKGKPKPLGVWDFDGIYKRFKTLGAKRYITEDDTEQPIHITAAGIAKKSGGLFLCLGWSQDIKTREDIAGPFSKFCDSLEVPAEYSGRLIHTYIDEEQRGAVIDYKGNSGKYCERSAVYLEPSAYQIQGGDFLDIIKGIGYYDR